MKYFYKLAILIMVKKALTHIFALSIILFCSGEQENFPKYWSGFNDNLNIFFFILFLWANFLYSLDLLKDLLLKFRFLIVFLNIYESKFVVKKDFISINCREGTMFLCHWLENLFLPSFYFFFHFQSRIHSFFNSQLIEFW